MNKTIDSNSTIHKMDRETEILFPHRDYTIFDNDSNEDEHSLEKNSFSVVQFNVLASSLCDNQSFPNTNVKYLDRDYRMKLLLSLMENIKSEDISIRQESQVSQFSQNSLNSHNLNNLNNLNNSQMADIYAFEEMDEHLLFSEFFESRNYYWFWSKKSIGLDGCGIAINLDRFIVEDSPIVFKYLSEESSNIVQIHSNDSNNSSINSTNKSNSTNDSTDSNITTQQNEHKIKYSNQIVVFIRLVDRITLKKLVVACTHLKAKEGFEELRHYQAKQLINNLFQFKNEGYIPIICGDFNEIPTNPAIQEILKYFESTYPVNQDIWTTWKKRSSEVCRMIDYIFYDPRLLKLWKIQNIMSKNTLNELLPARNFPSDHVNLLSIFKY